MNDKYFLNKFDTNSDKLREILDNSVESLSEKLLESFSKEILQNSSEHLKYMGDLIQKGADINYRGKDGRVVICEVARYSNPSELKHLLSLGIYINTKDFQGNSPLHASIYNPDLGNLIILLDNYAFIDSINILGNTPLMEAITIQNIQAIKILLSRGADITIKNVSGKTAIDLANETEDENIIKLFKENTKRLWRNKK